MDYWHLVNAVQDEISEVLNSIWFKSLYDAIKSFRN